MYIICCAGKLQCKTITEISNDQSFLKNILQLFYNYCVNYNATYLYDLHAHGNINSITLCHYN